MTAETAAGTVRADSVIAFHPLARRIDGLEVIIGRNGSDVFIALPAIGADAIAMLARGMTIREVEDRIEAATGDRIDVADLASALLEHGMVAEVDGAAVPADPPIPVTLPRLAPAHVRWLLHRTVHIASDVALSLLIVASVLLAAQAEAPFPNHASLLWSDNGSLVIATQVVIGWSLILVHEAAHLVTARAAGVPGRVEFGTRLQFLVAQTNVTGIWAAPLRHRLAVYTAGMRADLFIGALALLVSTRLAPGGVPHRLALVVAVLAATGLIVQLLIFMRTDVYFIVQDLTRSRNLYGDGGAYARHLAGRAASCFRGRAVQEANPLAGLEARERRTVQGYTVLLVAGTGVCLAYAAVVVVPFAIGLVQGALTAIASARPAAVLDGLVVLAVQAAFLAIWSRTWWKRHGHRFRKRPRATGAFTGEGASQ